MIESLSIAACCLPHQGFSADLRACVDAEIGGLGPFESKLVDRPDAEMLGEFLASGLRATLAVPTLWSIFPSRQSPEPTNLNERVELLCASVRRLAMFDPVAIGVHTGPVTGPDGEAALIAALRTISRAATFLHPRPVDIAIEPVGPDLGAQGWPIATWTDALRMHDEIAQDNVRIVLDTFHLGDFSGEDIGRELDRIGLVQLADVSSGPSGPVEWTHRRPPGEGRLDFAAILQAVYGAGYRGWYELELWPGSPEAGAELAGALGRARETVRDLHTALLAGDDQLRDGTALAFTE